MLAIDSATRATLHNAEVLVLSDTWEKLAEAKTDKVGVASVPLINASLRPKYIIILKEYYFIGGTFWAAGAREHYVLVPPLAVR